MSYNPFLLSQDPTIAEKDRIDVFFTDYLLSISPPLVLLIADRWLRLRQTETCLSISVPTSDEKWMYWQHKQIADAVQN